MEREIPTHAEGEAALIGFGGNDIDYDWRAVAADPHAEHLPQDVYKRQEWNTFLNKPNQLNLGGCRI